MPSLVPSGHHRAGQRNRDGLAGGDVGGAADDRPLAIPGVDLADAEPVGVGVLLDREHLADDEALRDPARRRGVIRSTSIECIASSSASSSTESFGSQ